MNMEADERKFEILFLLLFLLTVAGCPKPPVRPERPWGPALALKNFVYSCSTSVAEPAGGEVAFQFDWGDGTRSGWSNWIEVGRVFGDTHTYTQLGDMQITVRVKNRQGKVSDWSEPLEIYVSPGEGTVWWRFGYFDPEDPEDSADFSTHTFAIGQDGRVYIGSSDICALLCRNQRGARIWEFVDVEEDEFCLAPVIGDDGTIYVGTDGGRFYALNSSGTVRASTSFRSPVVFPPALGIDGTVFVQTEDDTFFALDPVSLNRRWYFYHRGGGQSPVVGTDGTVYISEDDTLFALDPGNGSIKWQFGMRQALTAPPTIDSRRGYIYTVDEDGWLVCLNLENGSENWRAWIGTDVSAPVIGEDGTIYLTGNGRLWALTPAGSILWEWTPAESEALSMPAVSSEGVIYFLAFSSVLPGAVDSLYAVNVDGTRRWAVGLGAGTAGEFNSCPKIDDAGLVYIGSGYRAWCVIGKGGPANSPWPMYQGDVRNSGRVR